jgi:hypothetical protein
MPILGLSTLVGALAVGAGAVLAAVLDRPALGLVAGVIVLVVGQVLVTRLSREQLRGRQGDLERVTRELMTLVDLQAKSLSEQEAQVVRLRAALGDDRLRDQIWREIDREMTPRLEAVVDRLEEAEASLPDMLHQTRAWMNEVRRLATQAQASVESIRDEVAGR